MSSDARPQFTEISKQLATRMPTKGVPEEGVAEALRDTLYHAKDRGILEDVSRMIADQADGDEVVVALAEALRESTTP